VKVRVRPDKIGIMIDHLIGSEMRIRLFNHACKLRKNVTGSNHVMACQAYMLNRILNRSDIRGYQERIPETPGAHNFYLVFDNDEDAVEFRLRYL
jgi:hypothetical protein